MLTKGLDNVSGTSGNDTIIGSIANGATDPELNTLSTLDIVNGGAGTDTLKISSSLAAIVLPNMTNVEVVEVEGAAGVTVDTSTTAGVTNLNVLKAATAVSAKAAATTDINVSLKQGTAVVNGTGADTKADIAVTGGKNVSVNVTDVKQVLGDNDDADPLTNPEINGIVVGGAGTAAAAGTVTVTSTGAATAANSNATLSSITVTGGSTISVTQKATSDGSAAATDKSAGGTTITQGAVTVTGNAATTTVTVKQDAAVGKVQAEDAVAAKATTEEVVFTAAKKGDVITIDFGAGSLAFTANKDLTAAEVASAFANLAKDAKQGNAAASLGIYTDADADAGDGKTITGVSDNWTSGAVETVSATQSKVVFSSTTKLADLSATVTPVAGSTVSATAQNRVEGVTAVPAKTGVLGVANGAVTINDSAATIKTVTVDGYKTGSKIGTNGTAATYTTALETLNLSNAEGAATMTVEDTAATLALTLEKVGSSVTDAQTGAVTNTEAVLDLVAAPTTLNVKSVGNNRIDLDAVATETLNVSGTGTLTVDERGANELNGLKAIKVTETAGLTLTRHGTHTDNITSVDTTGTTGTTTISIKGDAATYTGGAGVDKVTITNANTAIAKAIDLGAGDDTLTLNVTAGTVALPTVELKGGDGIDTIAMSAADAIALSANAAFEAKMSGFEKLSIGAYNSTTAAKVDLANMDDISYVLSANSAGTAAAAKATFAGIKATITATDTLAVNYNGAGSVNIAIGAIGGTGTDADKLAAINTALDTQYGAGKVVATFSGNDLVLTAAGNVVTDTLAVGNYTDTETSNTTAGVAAAAGAEVPSLTIDNMASGGTLELTAGAAGDAGVTVLVKDATTGTADVLNIVTSATSGSNLGTVEADKVETLNVTVKDMDASKTAGVDNVSTNTLKIDADAAKTINLSGAGNLVLTFSNDTKEVTLIDGSTATGKLTVTTVAGDTAATTVKGGSAADTLTAQGANDVLLGGAGNDVLKVVGLAASAVTLTGGEGVDQFDVSGFTAANAGAAATITDFTKGETIKFASNANANFASSKVTLIGEATFDNYVTEAAKAAKAASGDATGNYGVAWFQFNGNTFLVQDNVGGTAGVFDNGTDIIVKLTGLVDLSASSFNEVGQGTLLYI